MADLSIGLKRRQYLDLLERYRREIHKVIIGHDDLLDSFIICLIAPPRNFGEQWGGNLLIEGVHGGGKTLFVKISGRVLKLKFSRIQGTVDVDPSSITGSCVFDKNRNESVFRPGSLFANIVLADEITRIQTKLQANLFEGMEEQTVTVDGVTYRLPRPFYLVATTNIAEELGTVLYQLPMGQRDRFFMSLRPKGLDDSQELLLYSRPVPPLKLDGQEETWGDVKTVELEQVLDAPSLESISLFIARNYPIPMGSVMNRYVARLVKATRLHLSILYGASHRAAIDLARAAQAAAFLADDDLVTQSHVVDVFERVMQLRMRLVTAFEKRTFTDVRSVPEVLRDIIGTTPLFEG